jgi:NitT/TauT family transport system substrate-binding protein
MPIVLQETQRAVFYAPFYAALALGAYRDEGLDVVLKSSTRPDEAARSVTEGTADLSWGGPMRVIVSRDRDIKSDLVCFCEVVTRDPFFLIGKKPLPGFKFSDLFGVNVAIVSEVPTPWYCLQEDVRRAGLDPLKLTRTSARTMAENTQLLQSDGVDVVQVLEPFADELIASGLGHIWWAAADRGHASYTCFYTRRPILDARRAEFTAMTRAIYRTQRLFQTVGAEDIAPVVADFFPNIPRGRLVHALTRYRALGVWGKDPRLPRSGYDRLKAGILSADAAKYDLPFEQAVDNSLAHTVIAENPPVLSTVR